MAIEVITGIGTLLGGLFGGRRSSNVQPQYDSVSGSLTDSTSEATQQENTTTQQNTSGTQQDRSLEESQQNTSGVTQNFSNEMVDQLEQQLGATLGAGGVQQAQLGLTQQLQDVMAIDPTKQANDIANAANRTIMRDANANINGMESATGGSTKGNSMLALLDAQIKGDAASQVAGIRADALQSAQAAKTQQIAGLAGASAGIVGDMIQSVAGARQTNTGTATEVNSGTQTQLSTESVAGSQQGNTSATQNTTSSSLENSDLLGVGVDGAANSDLLTHLSDRLGVKPRPQPVTPPPVSRPPPPPVAHPRGGGSR